MRKRRQSATRQPSGPLLWFVFMPSIEALVYFLLFNIQARRTIETDCFSSGDHSTLVPPVPLASFVLDRPRAHLFPSFEPVRVGPAPPKNEIPTVMLSPLPKDCKIFFHNEILDRTCFVASAPAPL